MKKIIIAGLIFMVVVLVVAGYKYSQSLAPVPPPSAESQKINSEKCLAENERVIYEIEEKKRNLGDVEADVNVFIVDKETNLKKSSFQIEDIRKNYHPIEVYECGVYIIRMFNYDPKTTYGLGYRAELWRFGYDGTRKTIFIFNEIDGTGTFRDYFATDFRVDPTENYVALYRGYPGSPDFALVIKSLKTLDDIFVLLTADVAKKNPDIVANLMPNDWSKDGRYFWADFFTGAPVLGFIRVDSQTWTYDLFSAPPEVLGGDALNTDNGWLTVHPNNVWYGDLEFTEQEKAKRRAQGIGTELYIHNLITGKRQFVASTTEPLWYFKPKWISDNELQYTLPIGVISTYRLRQ